MSGRKTGDGVRTFEGRDISDARLTRLEAVSFANAEEGEGEFVERLNANPELLLDEPVLLIGHEHGFDVGRLDLLGLDEFGNTVVFEVKTGKSGTKSASETTIISQPQYYASRLEEYDYAGLNEVYQQYRQRVRSGRLRVSAPDTGEETLSGAFESRFGTSLDEEDYNTYQRMVIVAEEITTQTEETVRYLQKRGLDMECTEVQRFSSGTEGEVMYSTTQPVSYPRERIRPDDGGEGYFELIRSLSEMLYNRTDDILGLQSPNDLSKTGTTYLEFGPRTAEGDPTERIRYGFYPHFADDGRGTVYIGVWGRTTTEGERLVEVVEENVDCLDGFTPADGQAPFGVATVVAKKDITGRRQPNGVDAETTEHVAGELERVITTLHPILKQNVDGTAR
jgi:hypothetical protein